MSEDIMRTLVIDDGSRRYTIENTLGETIGEFTVNPADFGILERLSAMEEEIRAITEPFADLNPEERDIDMADVTGITGEVRERMFAAVDRLLGREGAGAKLFGKVHPFAPVEGRFYFDRVFEWMGRLITETIQSETAKFAAPQVQKYTARKKK